MALNLNIEDHIQELLKPALSPTELQAIFAEIDSTGTDYKKPIKFESWWGENKTTFITSLDDNTLLHCVQYLYFEDLVKLLHLNKKLHTLFSHPNALHTIKNYPFETYTSIRLIAALLNSINGHDSTKPLIFHYKIHKLDWIHGADRYSENKVQMICELFTKLRYLKHLKFTGTGFDFLNHLPKQQHLTHLILTCDDNDYQSMQWENVPFFYGTPPPDSKLNMLTFLQSKVDTNSLHLLKEFTVSQMLINAALLKILANMKNLEIFSFESLVFDSKQRQKGLLTPQLIMKCFSSWEDLKIVNMYHTFMLESEHCTFTDHPLNDAVLKSLLCVKSLQQLKFAINPCNQHILPYFNALTSLKMLQFFAFYDNVSFMCKILDEIKIVNNSLATIKIISDSEEMAHFWEDEKKLNQFKHLLFKCLSMVTKGVEIKLPYQIGGCKSKYLEILCDLLVEYNVYNNNSNINRKLKYLLVESYCDGMTWQKFLSFSAKLSQAFYGISNKFRISLSGESFATRANHDWWTRLDGSKWDGCYSAAPENEDEEFDVNVPYVHKDWKQLEQLLAVDRLQLYPHHKYTESVYLQSINWE